MVPLPAEGAEKNPVKDGMKSMSELNIGQKVQEFRKKSGMSLRELAAQAELSPSMLSQIESNSVNPSINTLKNISEALRVPLFQFFKEDVPTDNVVVRRGESRIIGREGEEVLYKLLTPDTSGAIEFCLMEIPAGTASSDMPREHDGEEVAYVVRGATDILLGGVNYHLNEGDSIKIAPSAPHQWINREKEDVAVIFAVTPPGF